MKTIQLTLQDSDYTQSLRNLLVRDGTHRVYVVDRPDMRLDGVVVIDGKRAEDLALMNAEPERFVVITSKASEHLAKIWDAGIRHVVFDGDSPSTAQLAIISAELQLPGTGVMPTKNSPTQACLESRDAEQRGSPSPNNTPVRCGRCGCSSPNPQES